MSEKCLEKMMNRRSRFNSSFLIVLTLALFPASRLAAQGSAGTGARVEPRYIVDMPTAGMLAKGTFAIDGRVYGNGGLLVGFSAGIFSRLAAGISYGGSGIIGAGDPVMNVAPGFFVKVRIIEESVVSPAIALGFDSQGYDGYIKELSRYVIKSPGFYGVISKNYDLLGYLSIHGGVNYSLERADGDQDVNFYAGAEKSLGSFASLVVEYNLGMNDSNQGASGKGLGYLNAALQFSPGSGLTIGLCLKDILQNGAAEEGATRTMKIEFVNSF
jgi:hypothetical protein